MRTQEELKEYYQSIDSGYQGENPPEGWRFLDLDVEYRPKKLKTYVKGTEEWEYRDYNPMWVWITDLPLPDFAPERQRQKQLNQASHTNQTQTNQTQTSMNKSKTYIVNYGPVNYEVPETALRALFLKDPSYNRFYCNKSPFDIVREFLTHGSLSQKPAEVKINKDANYLVTPSGLQYFSFPPPYTRTVKFVYRKNRDEVNWRTLGVTEETDTYLCGIDLADNQFKKFLREKILGGEIIEVADKQTN
jgi:hypothetical protein